MLAYPSRSALFALAWRFACGELLRRSFRNASGMSASVSQAVAAAASRANQRLLYRSVRFRRSSASAS